jgi:biopolymer transport protein ExbD
MAQLNESPATNNGRQKPGVPKILKSNLRIDMTPMVDLGFLLISFFVIVSQLQEPTSMPIAMPKDSDSEPMPVGGSYALTVLLHGDKTYYYEGSYEKAMADNSIKETTLAAVREVIVAKQQRLDNKNLYKDGRDGLMLMIKPTADAGYKSVVDALDECTITGVKRYALLKLSSDEKKWLADK